MPLLATLKAETTAAHEGLEQSMDVFRQVRTVDDYRTLLRRFFTLYEPLEQELARAVDWNSAGWDFAARLKTAWLRTDLFALGASEHELMTWPRCAEFPRPASLGEGVGVLYVLEGSTLGGQMISKHFNGMLGTTPENGGKFFAGYGPATGTHWRAFGQWAELQNDAGGRGVEQSAVQGARKTFDAFSRWFTP